MNVLRTLWSGAMLHHVHPFTNGVAPFLPYSAT
jgi:hypothetical protein